METDVQVEDGTWQLFDYMSQAVYNYQLRLISLLLAHIV